MFASVALATRIDRAETRLTETLGHVVLARVPGAFIAPIAGGVAVYAGPDSPMNKLIGVGFAGVPDEAALGAIEARFAACGAPLQAEVSTLADPAFAAELTRRGYVLRNFENVSGRAIVTADRDPPPSVQIEPMTPAGVDALIDAAITSFQQPDGKGVPADELPPRDAFDAALRPFATADGFERYCAIVDGALAGIATLRIDDGVAQLCGAATLPAYRRRGIQAALLRRRLADAARAGCDLAVLTTQPGSTSQENGHRQGFALLYPRAILVYDRAARNIAATMPSGAVASK